MRTDPSIFKDRSLQMDGAIVVKKAGGRITDMNGKPLDFRASAQLIYNRGIVASNGTLHQAVLEAIRTS